MNLVRLARSFGDAWKGVKYVFKHEQNFRFQAAAALAVLAAGVALKLERAEFVLVFFLIIAVLVLELINSAVEKFADLLKPRLSHQIEVIKDIMAAVVFLAAFGSLVIGLIIFWPHLGIDLD
ncbi:MAG: diacylglycerol kinase family protein [Candidatus Magasanikbacteria bacterium]|nr:diacylglycerol kinase family protein [Candidatus Magasanikbacteria bacterium]